MTAFYRIEHGTRYLHTTSVSTSQHVAYLRPRELPRQRVAWSHLAIDPMPARFSRRIDYFGNIADQFTVLTSYVELDVVARTLVEVNPFDPPAPVESSPPWETAREALAYRKGWPAGEAAQFAYTSTYINPDSELLDFARASFPTGRPLLAGAIDLMHRIHDGFEFDPSSTTLTTPVSKVLAQRRGVCQDFAHLEIACLRALGLAARYVSGYLLTDPPPGQPRLVGADASHAWLSVYCPQFGWVDLDPTNDVLPAERHVILAWGRDYADVSPLRGVILGGAQHSLQVGVSVIPLNGDEWTRAVVDVKAG